jgi:16S rRNA (uracil1498-N3)-methyltransferase
MREIRLFVDAPMRAGLELALPEGAARHALRVLRLQPGAALTLFNGDGLQYAARLGAVDARAAMLRIEAAESVQRESPLRVTLLQAVARGDKMDWIIQKATELGVAGIWPVLSERSEVKLDPARSGKRLDHWRAIAISACEQCGRNVVPELHAPTTLAGCVATPATSARWMLHPGGTSRVREIAMDSTALTLAVGPEGGFGDGDLAILRQAGYRALTLGPRILRTETAGLAALAAVQALSGDF